jgi:hypothetical protein
MFASFANFSKLSYELLFVKEDAILVVLDCILMRLGCKVPKR